MDGCYEPSHAVGDRNAPLNAEQEIWLKERVMLLMAWHRSNELPQWQRWLTEARERAAGMPEASDLRATYVRGLGADRLRLLSTDALLAHPLFQSRTGP